MTRGLRSVVVAAAILAPLTPATAVSDRRPPSRLDAKILYREGGNVAVVPRPLDDLAPSDALRGAWEGFRTRYGGSWSIYVDERTAEPALVSGTGIRWLPAATAKTATLDDLDGRARSFLHDNAKLIGTGSGTLELDRAASGKLRDGHWQLVYRQNVDGVRVENARLDLHVVRGRMTMMGTSLWGRPRIRGVPDFDAGPARDFLEAYLATDAALLRPVGAPELTMIAVDSGGTTLGHVLVWRFLYDEADAPRRWAGEVDAHDGSVRAFYEVTQYASVRGGVVPIGPDGDCLHGGCETAGFPMPFADATEEGRPVGYGDDFGNLACVDPGATFTTTLSGPYVAIDDTCGPVSETGSCAGGLDLGLKHGENCDVAPGSSPGNTAAARTSYYHVNRVAQIARFYDPTNAWLQSPVTVHVNIASSCNANWDGTAINMFGAGSNCNNTGENADILDHEWGHGYDKNDGGGIDKPSEAYSDITAILTSRDSCMGRGMYNDGSTCTGYGDTCLTCTGFRDFDWAARVSGTPATPTNFAYPRCQADGSSFGGPCGREPHCESYVSSEAMFDLATRDLPAMGMDQDSAWQLVDRLWFVTRPGSGGDAYTCLSSLSNSCGATSWYQRMRVADDDDGDLANGTPHAAALFAAFRRHDIACGAVGDATNQNHSSCPALAAPVVARATAPEGIELSWAPVAGASEYRVYRGELGCDRQQVPIASLPAGQTTFVDDSADSVLVRQYRVQAFGAAPACASPVSDCVAAPPGSRLQVSSHRVVDGGNGIPEPGETFSLPVSLLNAGADTATAVAAHLDPLGPSVVRVLGPSSTWAPIVPSATVESDAPYFQVVVLDQARCGDTLDFQVGGAAENSAPFSAQIAIPMGTRTRDYTETSIVPIPYVTTEPVQVTWDVTDDRTIADLDVTLDIFHQDPTQIVVDLTSPQGTTVRLHDRSVGSGHGIETRFDRDTAPDGPGSMADFVGESTLGTWTLSVEDLDPSGITTDGYIRPRTLNVTIDGAYDCTPHVCPDPTPTIAPDLRVEAVPNGSDLDLVLTWTAVAGAAGYHVLQSEDPTFATGVSLLGTTTTETTLTVANGAGTTPARTYLQARAVNACHQEGP